jgi:hypothetical protein
MKTLIAAILLATLAAAAAAEPKSRQIRFVCGSFEDVEEISWKRELKFNSATTFFSSSNLFFYRIIWFSKSRK